MSPYSGLVSFPLSRAARQKFDFEAPSFSDFNLARELAAKINATRDLEAAPSSAVKSGRLAAAALLNEIFAHVIALYCAEVEPTALESAPSFVDANVGEVPFAALLTQLHDDFNAPKARPATTEYALRLKLANLNPALGTFRELFDESELLQPVYDDTFKALDAYFQTLPPYGDDDLSLWNLLLQPIRRHPDSIDDQLRFILNRWERLIAPFAARMLVHLDLIREEEKPTFFGPGPALVPDYTRAVGADEYEAFTQDKEWMPRVVLIAKQTYVWLDQLSKKYGHHIYRFDQVPDAELDEMAARGITGLWLIGLWQRSHASQRIKQMTGNPDAIASAYSLYSYGVAWELGGQEALDDLASRAAARGIRMASDMVPNHMAIDSQWVVEHPDWFLSLPYQPFPNASFDGPDLCDDSRASVYLENGYYSKTDASVVFKRVDTATGETSYIYHGNDGTSIPWNDTAQLNYLSSEVREAVMQVIIAVAKQFPIIRFDAAMTLAKKHVHRLWFPSPGSGGDIPSRAGRGLSPDEFDALMPHEFWREVVDRIAIEAPDTLLLAEAFWMMEGYFVRTLGMHRVYNSAFMNMLRDEKNAEYRLTIKNTLEFDPDILGRFVNFMNNPDEKTAVEQFGKSDKYFGVATLLATLPGLPMFGHGQIEGYAEKYGMEYPRAYWNEVPDEPFIAYHERVIFPLLHKRALFAGSENFALYDFWNGEGSVNEDVFAYSNRAGEERALIVYNNRYADASGWIKTSVASAEKHADGSKTLVQRTLGEALGLSPEKRCWAIFRENTSNLEFLRHSHEVLDKGLFVTLKPYGCQVFLDWREVRDESGLYERLATQLGGAGVPSVELALKEMVMEPLLSPWKALCAVDVWQDAFEGDASALEARGRVFADAVGHFLGEEVDVESFVAGLGEWTQGHLEEGLLAATEPVAIAPTLAETLPEATPVVPVSSPTEVESADESVTPDLAQYSERATLLAYALLKQLGELGAEKTPHQHARLWLDEWLLAAPLEATLRAFEAPSESLPHIRLWLSHCSATPTNSFGFLSKLLTDTEVQTSLGINNWENTLWFKGEGLDALIETLELGAALEGVELPLVEIATAADAAEFRVVKWMEIVRKNGSVSPTAMAVAALDSSVPTSA